MTHVCHLSWKPQARSSCHRQQKSHPKVAFLLKRSKLQGFLAASIAPLAASAAPLAASIAPLAASIAPVAADAAPLAASAVAAMAPEAAPIADEAAPMAAEAAPIAASAAGAGAGAGAGAAAGAGAGAAGAGGAAFSPQAAKATAATRVASASDFFISGFLLGGKTISGICHHNHGGCMTERKGLEFFLSALDYMLQLGKSGLPVWSPLFQLETCRR